MKFKAGDKVWIDVCENPIVPVGSWPGVVIDLCPFFGPGLWIVDIEGFEPPPGDAFVSNERYMRPRFDPPPQQEPKREAVGSWDQCVWKPEGVSSWDQCVWKPEGVTA
jgi:hypothetical protein